MRYNHYLCSGYAKQIKECSAHYITESKLAELVLCEIKKVVLFANKDFEHFKAIVSNQIISSNAKRLAQIEKELSALNLELDELQNTLSLLYMDKLKGNVSQEVFILLSEENAKKQNSLKSQRIELNEEAVKIKKSSSDVNHFFSIVSKYECVETLNYDVLHSLVERIKVYEGVGTRKSRNYNVDVYFVGVGVIDLENFD